ncbi:MAG: Uma2 family endonuclease [Chloroherpetonaceae bacterium]
MPLAETKTLTPAEYLAFERQSDVRHEYDGGELRLMAGASRTHNLIAGNIFAICHQQLRGKLCKPFMTDMRIWIQATQRYFYPDIAVICGTAPFVQEDMATDATLIVEVLSDTTEAFDRGKKFESYQCLPSLQEYVLVSQRAVRVEHFHKLSSSEWRYTVLNTPEAVISLEAIGVEIPLHEIYADVELNST